MSIHLTSIIPLIVSLVLLALGLTFSNLVAEFSAAVVFIYGLLIHTKNVALIRKDTHYRGLRY